MSTKFKRLVSVFSVLAVVMCMFSGVAGKKQVNALPGGNPVTVDPPPPPVVVIGKIEFSPIGLSMSTFPQGTNSVVYGRVMKVQRSVELTVTLKRYYNSYSPYAVATFKETRTPNSDGNVFLYDTTIFKSKLNLASRPAGHYVIEVKAKEGFKTIVKNIDFTIT